MFCLLCIYVWFVQLFLHFINIGLQGGVAFSTVSSQQRVPGPEFEAPAVVTDVSELISGAVCDLLIT